MTLGGGWTAAFACGIVVVGLTAAAALSTPPGVAAGPNAGGILMTIEQVFDRHHDRLMAVPGVTGLGIGDKGGKQVILVMVEQLTPDLKARIPRALEGYPVVVEQSGEIVAF